MLTGSDTSSGAQPTEVTNVDVAIIGLGSAGEALAGRLLEAGLSVVGFEPGLVGGECPFTACMPSKALLHDAHLLRSRANGEVEEHSRQLDAWRKAVERRDEVAEQRNDSGHASSLISDGITLVRAKATIVGPGLVMADGAGWSAAHVVVATGSSPVMPPIPGLDSPGIWTSEDALTETELPKRLVIVGAGAIGCELGDVYRSYGSEVTLLEAGDRLLPDHDAEAAALYLAMLRANGLDVRLSAEVSQVAIAHSAGSKEESKEESREESTVYLADGSSIVADRILVAAGQEPRLAGLGLASIGLAADQVPVFDSAFTDPDRPWLHLIGDVNGQSPWTHGANREAAILAASMTNSATTNSATAPMPAAMPHCVFTDPPASHVGVSLDDHEAAGGKGVRGVARTSDIARSSTDRLGDGIVVLTIDLDSGVIVGGSAVGPLADELIATVTCWVHLHVTIERAASQVFAFPTISQMVEVAASRGLETWRTARAA